MKTTQSSQAATQKDPKKVLYTASEARANLYSILRDAGTGVYTPEVISRSSPPVIIMSKADYEGWQETLDIMSNPEEVAAIRRARKQKKTYTHAQVRKILGLTGK